MSTLYSTELLALAADIPHLGRLDHATGRATCRSPVCGSTVSADVVMDGDRVTEFAQEVKSCLLGQAAAALLGRHVLQTDPHVLRQAVRSMLEGGAVPEGFAPLAAARDIPSRHPAILLPFDAVIDAIEKSRQR